MSANLDSDIAGVIRWSDPTSDPYTQIRNAAKAAAKLRAASKPMPVPPATQKEHQ